MEFLKTNGQKSPGNLFPFKGFLDYAKKTIPIVITKCGSLSTNSECLLSLAHMQHIPPHFSFT